VPEIKKRQTVLAVFAIIFASLSFLASIISGGSTLSTGLIVFCASPPVLFSGLSFYATRKDGKVGGRVSVYVAIAIIGPLMHLAIALA
jgi:hypothetical protein